MSSARCCRGLLQIHLTGVTVNSVELLQFQLDVLCREAVCAIQKEVMRLTGETDLIDRFIDLRCDGYDITKELDRTGVVIVGVSALEVIVLNVNDDEYTTPITMLTIEEQLLTLKALEVIEPRKLKLRLGEGVNEYA